MKEEVVQEVIKDRKREGKVFVEGGGLFRSTRRDTDETLDLFEDDLSPATKVRVVLSFEYVRAALHGGQRKHEPSITLRSQ